MAADLHIHVQTPEVTDEVLARFFGNTLGSKHFNPRPYSQTSDKPYEIVARSPNIWIGEVSWLKAALLGDGDGERFVPGPIQVVQQAIGEDLPVIDDDLIAKIGAAFDVPNTTSYSLAKKIDVWRFLETHRGKRVFTVSW
jgi:hypothetical protein